jgi:REP element-mobilizing transposase RayT
MARPLRIQYNGAFYHVTARGNEKKRIYFSHSDYEQFKYYLRKAQGKFDYLLHCFVLMVNHYHLVIETPNPNLHKVMHYINSSYTNYVNKKKKRSGHLLQGRYKAILIDQDSYLLELSRYIHLNPVRAEMVLRPEEYPYSSYVSFINRGDDIVYRDFILRIISKNEKEAIQNYKSFVEEAIGEKLDNPLNKIYGGAIAGGDLFVKKVLRRLRNVDLDKGEISNRRELKSIYRPEEIIEKISLVLNVSRDGIVNSEIKDSRAIAIYLMKKYTGLTNREIGHIFGNLSYSGVSKVNRRFEKKIQKDSSLKRKVLEIMSNVKG